MEILKLEKITLEFELYYRPGPDWMPADLKPHFIVVDKEASDNDVKCFLITYLGINNFEQEITKANFYDVLCTQDEAIICGGFCFHASKTIRSSCCCGVEQIHEVVENAKHNKSVWLGHAPSPDFIYQDDYIIVDSDSELEMSEPRFGLKASREVFFTMINQAERGFKEFLEGPLRNYLIAESIEHSEKIVDLLKKTLAVHDVD